MPIPNSYAPFLGKGFYALAKATEEEALAHPAQRDTSGDTYRKHATILLASIPKTLVSAIVNGDVVKEASKPELNTHVKFVRESVSQNNASICIRVFVDSTNKALTNEQGVQLAALLNQYGTEAAKLRLDPDALKAARRIEVCKSPRWTKGPAKMAEAFQYLRTRTEHNQVVSFPISQARIPTLLEFAQILRTQAQADPTRLKESMSFPLSYVGYARNGDKRESDHKNHRSSSWLMDLVEAAAGQLWFTATNANKATSFGLFENFSGHFRFKKVVALLLWEEHQASIAEVLISCLAKAYITSGRGVGVHPAGESIYSAVRTTPEEWDLAAKRILNESNLIHAMEEEAALLTLPSTESEAAETELSTVSIEQAATYQDVFEELLNHHKHVLPSEDVRLILLKREIMIQAFGHLIDILERSLGRADLDAPDRDAL